MASEEKQMSEREELKPCPFCGDPNPGVDHVEDRSEWEWVVTCSDWKNKNTGCAAEVRDAFATRKEAIAAWNRRAPAPSEAAAPIRAKFVDAGRLPPLPYPDERLSSLPPAVPVAELRALIRRWESPEYHSYQGQEKTCAEELAKLILQVNDAYWKEMGDIKKHGG